MQRSDVADGENAMRERPEHGVDADMPDTLPPTSRICVKNLPKHVGDDRLKEHFSAKGEVTDAKVMRTSDGRSRCFGFIGFRSAEEAEAAVKYFNKTFMDTMRLVVEFAYKYGPPAVRPRQAWSKYTDGTSANKRVKAATGANGVCLGEGNAASLTAREAKKKAKGGRERKPEEEDPKLREFMALMQPRSKQAIWSNDDIVAAAAAPPLHGRSKAAAAVGAGRGELEDGGSEDELYQDLPEGGGAEELAEDGAEDGAGDALVTDAAVSDMDYLRSRVRRDFDATDVAVLATSDSESEESAGGSSATDEDEEQAAAGGDGGSGSGDEEGRDDGGAGKPAGNDSMDSIFGARPAARQDTSGAAAPAEDAAPLPRGAAAVEMDDGAAEAAPEVVIAETGRLFVRNLAYTAAEEDIRSAFEPYGEVEEVHVVVDKATRRSKGFALVQFAAAEAAVAAHLALDGSIFMGRLMHVLPGKRAPAPAPAEAETAEGGGDGKGGGTSSYKRQRESELKATAGNRAAWNSLFMRADTVAEAVAAHYGVTKAELLDPRAADMAVRLALGETHVIAETKAALSEAGVDIASLEVAAASAARGKAAERGGAKGADVARSERALLVKNLPFSVGEADLEAMFGGVGPLARLVLPPTRTLAVVEFVEAQDARRAFQSLAYKRYQQVPLYLEWAPAGIFNKPASEAKASSKAAATASRAGPAAASPGQNAGTKKGGKEGKVPVALAAGLGAAEAEDDAVESSSIYVKNLAFATTDAALALHFEAAAAAAGGSLRSAKVAKRKSSEGRMLSAGFGFVECSDEGVARAAIKALQGSSLDGHKLVLQLAQTRGKGKSGALGSGPQETTKVVVRNVAFEATRKDILGLFTPFGHVKSCRLPRKFDGSHRGFAFVDFSTRAEARAAVDAVAGTHLYGRRLVIEWAEEDGGLDELRSKTAAKYRGEAAALLQGGGTGAEEGEQEGGGGGEEEAPARKKRRRGRGE